MCLGEGLGFGVQGFGFRSRVQCAGLSAHRRRLKWCAGCAEPGSAGAGALVAAVSGCHGRLRRLPRMPPLDPRPHLPPLSPSGPPTLPPPPPSPVVASLFRSLCGCVAVSVSWLLAISVLVEERFAIRGCGVRLLISSWFRVEGLGFTRIQYDALLVLGALSSHATVVMHVDESRYACG